MIARRRLLQMNCFASVVFAVFLVAAPQAFAQVFAGSDSVAVVDNDGHKILLGGAIFCGEDVERVLLRVTLTQVGAVNQILFAAIAEDDTVFECTPNGTQRWEVHAVARGNERFSLGSATATGVALSSRRGGDLNGAHQFLTGITLINR
jgi:hypothetical protein